MDFTSILKGILACKWIEKKSCPPPVLFQTLVDEVLEDHMKTTVSNLIKIKMQMGEAEKGKRIDKLNEYITDNLMYFKQKVNKMEDDRNVDWDTLNSAFIKILQNYDSIG